MTFYEKKKLGLKIHYDKVKTANDDGCIKANYIPVKDKAKQKIYTGMNKIIKAKQNLVQKNYMENFLDFQIFCNIIKKTNIFLIIFWLY